MKDLLDKLSSYNIFNYLLPGVVFVVLADALTPVHLIQKDIVVGVFLYYFIGLIISRIGSIILEPLLRKTGFVSFAHYNDYLSASKNDETLKTLSEQNNMYRTFCSLLITLIFIKIYEALLARSTTLSQWSSELIILFVLILFLFSYRKQTGYIKKRVLKNIAEDTKHD